MRTGWYAFGRSSFVKIQPGSAAKDVSRQLIVKGTQKWVSEMKFIEFISFRRDKSTVSQAHSCRKEVGQVIKSSVRHMPKSTILIFHSSFHTKTSAEGMRSKKKASMTTGKQT